MRKRKKVSNERNKMKGTLARYSQIQIGQQTLQSSFATSSLSSRFQTVVDSEAAGEHHVRSASPRTIDVDASIDDRDFILSQDFFWYCVVFISWVVVANIFFFVSCLAVFHLGAYVDFEKLRFYYCY